MTRILVVDDEEPIRKMLRQMLQIFSFEIVEAGNGEEALALALSPGIDLVITDYNMPRMDGAELLEKLHQHRPEFPCIMISAHPPDFIEKLDYVSFLKKPFRFDRLIALVRRFLHGEKEQPIQAPRSSPA